MDLCQVAEEPAAFGTILKTHDVLSNLCRVNLMQLKHLQQHMIAILEADL